jgi:hypothetical protein
MKSRFLILATAATLISGSLVFAQSVPAPAQCPRNGTAQQGQGPRDGTGYGSKNGKRSGPQNGTGQQRGGGQHRGGRR